MSSQTTQAANAAIRAKVARKTWHPGRESLAERVRAIRLGTDPEPDTESEQGGERQDES